MSVLTRLEKIDPLLIEYLDNKPTFAEYILNVFDDETFNYYNILVGRTELEKLYDAEMKIYNFYKKYYFHNYHDEVNLTLNEYFNDYIKEILTKHNITNITKLLTKQHLTPLVVRPNALFHQLRFFIRNNKKPPKDVIDILKPKLYWPNINIVFLKTDLFRNNFVFTREMIERLS